MASVVNTKRQNLDVCPVCDVELDMASLPPIPLSTARGHRRWARCPVCHSFFGVGQYELSQEIEHTRTMPWGMVTDGIALNDSKTPMFSALLRLIRRYSLGDGPLLDVGCSFGGFLRQAHQEGYAVRGVDIVPEAAEYVRNMGILCACARSVADLNIPEESLGVVSVIDCNYYWQNHKQELRAIREALSPEGLLVMRVVDTSWAVQIGLWLGQLSPETGRRLCEKAVYDHHVSIPVRTLLRIVNEVGFETIHASPWAAIPCRHNSLKVRVAYLVGQLAWWVFGHNLAPGFVLLARKRAL